MEAVGVLFFLGAITMFWRVFFNKNSKEYWEAAFWGKRFQMGCITPILGVVIASCFMSKDFSPMVYIIGVYIGFHILIWLLSFVFKSSASAIKKSFEKSPEYSEDTPEKSSKPKKSYVTNIFAWFGFFIFFCLCFNAYHMTGAKNNSIKEKNPELEKMLAENKRKNLENQDRHKNATALKFEDFKKFVNENYKNSPFLWLSPARRNDLRANIFYNFGLNFIS